MNYQESTWNGFRRLDFEFEGYPAILVLPNEPNAARRLAIKTEYFGAFPATEIAMLKAGYHLCYLKNRSRWGTDDDCDRKAHFIDFLADEFGTARKVVTVGMSCGGLIATTLAAAHPELIDVLYIDAPVLNLLSCPCGMGIANDIIYPEFSRVTGYTKSAMLSYRDHPIDKMHILLAHDIPVVLVVGDSDPVVPYLENGLVLENYYKKNGGRIRVWVKPGCAHHPHGLTDREAEVVDTIEAFSRENEEKRA
jgi:pimeloyl-ACP methyl ester carboxylesterase